MNPTPQEEQGKYVRARMEEFDTSELIAIWKENDRTEWTDVEFAVIHDILLERIHRVPRQGGATMATKVTTQEEASEEYTYHDFDTMVRISTMARALSWIFLGVVVLELVGLGGLYFAPMAIDPVGAVLNALPGVTTTAFLAVALRAIAEGVYVLLDIEDNTHRVATAMENGTKETGAATLLSRHWITE